MSAGFPSGFSPSREDKVIAGAGQHRRNLTSPTNRRWWGSSCPRGHHSRWKPDGDTDFLRSGHLRQHRTSYPINSGGFPGRAFHPQCLIRFPEEPACACDG